MQQSIWGRADVNMRLEVITIFPEILSGFVSSSLIGKACQRGLISLATRQLRDYADPPHFQVDDSPYGGGPGMVMKPIPLARAITASRNALGGSRTILLSAAGKPFRQADAERLSKLPAITFIAGRYEGVDQRVIDGYVDEEISIGDYVLMGGEVAAMVVIEAVTRLIPGVLGNPLSTSTESFSDPAALRLEAPHFTRPPEFEGRTVPEVLLSGDHGAIERWREEHARERTKRVRPDLCRGV